MTKTKTILLIGRSGRGKSTLANVMISGENIENKFKESSGSTSETRRIQVEKFEDKENKRELLNRNITTAPNS